MVELCSLQGLPNLVLLLEVEEVASVQGSLSKAAHLRMDLAMVQMPW